MLINIATRLDSIGEGTCDFYNKKGANFEGSYELQDFTLMFENPGCVDKLFDLLDFYKAGVVKFYHYLAVLETYRSQFIPNKT